MLAGGLVCCSIAQGDPWASSVVDYGNLGAAPYDSPSAVLGKPSTLIQENGWWPTLPGVFHCSMVYGAYRTDPDGNKLVTTILDGGHITVQFDPPIQDDPENWYGRDFIVFGNSRFTGLGYVQKDTNMESYTIKNGIERGEEPMTVSVSQDGVTWFDYIAGPYADDYAPTQSWAWDWVNHDWSAAELDFTKPVDPAFSPSDFGARTVADAIDMYKGSAGGTSFDIGGLDLPVDPDTGRKWIRYVKVTANIHDEFGFAYEGEVDALARVSHRVLPVSTGQAKCQPDGSRVIIQDAAVSAGTFETGPFCYVQGGRGITGIRLLGRVIPRGKTVTVYGDLDTLGGERVIRVTAIESTQPDGTVPPIGMPNKSVGGAFGPDNTGMLIRTWGRVNQVDAAAKSFYVNDGSGTGIKCIAPRNPADGVGPSATFNPPADNAYVTVTGISSLENDANGNPAYVLRLRDSTDVY